MPAYFIAEIGSNHNGSLEQAKQLVDSLKGTGVHAIKTAKRDVELHKDVWMATEYNNQHSYGENYYEHRKNLELDKNDFVAFKDYVKKSGFDFICSFTDINSFDFLVDRCRCDYYKIASSRVTDTELLKFIRDKKNIDNIILSTGMSELHDVYNAVRILEPEIIMQCTSSYPCAMYDCHLSVIDEYKRQFHYSKIGYSNHCTNPMACITAYTMGAEVIEFHYTLDQNGKGTDHKLSFVRHQVNEIIQGCISVDIMRGAPYKAIHKCELPAIKKLRADL